LFNGEVEVRAEFSDSTFGIGAVSRLTGIPMDTLRVWERRYHAVVPRRSPQNRRFYTRDDVTRLLLIKQLVEQGEPVGSVVHLSEADLRDQLRAHAELHQQSLGGIALGPMEAEKPAATLVFGDALPYQLQQWAREIPCIRVLGGHAVLADFEREALTSHPDLLIMEFPALQADAVARIRELLRQGSFRRTVVVYAFAAKTVLDRMRKLGVIALRAPVTPASLMEVLHPENMEPAVDWPAFTPAPRLAPRRYSGKDLAVIALTETRLLCECPQHLVDLVSRLSAFEDYSADCENRHEQDAIVHGRLHALTAEARALLEEALTFLLESEGIETPAPAPTGEVEMGSAKTKATALTPTHLV
jgi:MerR family transcriptional regulator, light-induced transcriptional regulator